MVAWRYEFYFLLGKNNIYKGVQQMSDHTVTYEILFFVCQYYYCSFVQHWERCVCHLPILQCGNLQNQQGLRFLALHLLFLVSWSSWNQPQPVTG